MAITHECLAYFKYYYFVAQLVNYGQSCKRNVRNTASSRKSSDKVRVKMNVRDRKMRKITWTTIKTIMTTTKTACLLFLLILFLYCSVFLFFIVVCFSVVSFFFLQTLHQDMRSNDSLAGCHVVIWYLFDVSQSFCLYLYYLQRNSGKPLLYFTRHH